MIYSTYAPRMVARRINRKGAFKNGLEGTSWAQNGHDSNCHEAEQPSDNEWNRGPIDRGVKRRSEDTQPGEEECKSNLQEKRKCSGDIKHFPLQELGILQVPNAEASLG